MLSRLGALFRRQDPAPAPPALAPDAPLAIVGDVHGCDDLLAGLLERLDREPGRRVIVVGDLIDRGEHSDRVLARLSARPDITCLMGNHELMCLDFIDRPVEAGARWLRYGGLQTLASYGVGSELTLRGGPASLTQARDGLCAAMGPDLVDWLRALPACVQSGNVGVVHAGADPARPLQEQKPGTLAWGHADFGKVPRGDGLWIVHGHTVVSQPAASGGQIAVDTGAYATGRLTAALVDPDQLRFVEETA